MPRGVKICPECKHEMGPRSKECPECGHDFVVMVVKQAEGLKPATVKVESAKSAKDEKKFIPVVGNIIHTPAGKCPIPFKGDVIEWAHALMSREDERSGNQYSASALKYWLRTLGEDNTFNSKLIDGIFANA